MLQAALHISKPTSQIKIKSLYNQKKKKQIW
jgi:hypothetical protein